MKSKNTQIKEIFDVMKICQNNKQSPFVLQANFVLLELQLKNLFEVITDNPRQDLTKEDLKDVV